MNKKIFSLLLVFAALFSVCTLESCKDTNEDLFNEVRIQNTKEYQALLDRINAIKECACVDQTAAIAELTAKYNDLAAKLAGMTSCTCGSKTSCTCDLSSIKSDIAALKTQIAELEAVKAEVATINTNLASLETRLEDALASEVEEINAELTTIELAVASLTNRVAALENTVGTLQTELTALAARVAAIEAQLEALANQVTGITVQSIYTPAFGTINTPFGTHSNVLVGYFSEMDGMYFKGEVIGGDIYSANAGKVYLTVDPSNVDFSGVNVSLVNSKGENNGVELSNLVKSEEVLVQGYTRAENNYLYETTATMTDKSKVQMFSLDKSGIKEVAKDILNYKDGVDLTKLANLVYNTVNTNLDANAVQVATTDGRAVVSKYEIAAVGVEPLNLRSMDAVGSVMDKLTDKAKSLANGVVNRVKNTLNISANGKFIDFSVSHINLNASGDAIEVTIPSQTIHVDGQTINVTFDKTITVEGETIVVKDASNNIIGTAVVADKNIPVTFTKDITVEGSDVVTDAIVVTVPLSDLGLDGLGDVNDLIDQVNNYLAKINNAFNKLDNTFTNVVETIFNKVSSLAERAAKSVKPVLYVKDGKTVKALSKLESQPTILDNDVVNIYPTSYSLELLVPFYKKWVQTTGAVIEDMYGNNINSVVIDGTTMDAKMTVASNGVVAISYAVVDYAGNAEQETYYVKLAQ